LTLLDTYLCQRCAKHIVIEITEDREDRPRYHKCTAKNCCGIAVSGFVTPMADARPEVRISPPELPYHAWKRETVD